jgi:hypothetical protein
MKLSTAQGKGQYCKQEGVKCISSSGSVKACGIARNFFQKVSMGLVGFIYRTGLS